MRDEQAFEQAICDIQETLNKAERQIARLGRDLQFLVGTGDLEIVRRGATGETLRPKIVIAELKGCDPLLWRPEHAAWMHIVEPRGKRRKVATKGGNGRPPGDDDQEQPAERKPPANIPEEN